MGSPIRPTLAAPPELIVLKIIIPPNTELPWHTHPMPNAGYILSGDLTVEKKETGEKKHLSQGEVLPEMVGALHRGLTGNSPVTLIVFYAGTKGMPLAEAAPK
ncbi:cupin domain-containing protein [Chitinimonas sp. BJB300]|uniref:cupin domain-containing protein n=1 Tax=Chitinimonas sp. BJB300 TaxID=1559339 RepID=UPI0018EA4557|nr:cupin domain-containing protein [Chitinimonas sp. BJB300]